MSNESHLEAAIPVIENSSLFLTKYFLTETPHLGINENMKKQFKSLEITFENGIYLFQVGATSFKARVDQKQPKQISFYEFNEKAFDLNSVKNTELLIAENFLRNEGFSWMSIRTGAEEDDVVSFPPFETLQSLPCLDERIEITMVMDIYDGPISGLLVHDSEMYWFDWCMDSMIEHLSKDSDFKKNGRVFSLRQIGQEQIQPARKWSERYAELSAEMNLVSNPHIYPVSEWQKKQLRTSEEIQADIDKLHGVRDRWELLPISAWTTESGQQFAAINTFWLSKEDSEKFEQWQQDIALALSVEDQKSLDRLFLNPPIDLSENEIYRFDLPERIVLRDYRGQALPEKFLMTSRHAIQDYSHTLKKSK